MPTQFCFICPLMQTGSLALWQKFFFFFVLSSLALGVFVLHLIVAVQMPLLVLGGVGPAGGKGNWTKKAFPSDILHGYIIPLNHKASQTW